ncbi:MAG: hypothetical protein DRP27_06910 [Thermotogae bacterium]|nr:MAG: hypothetical protein DRP27_06910 [Thermotogota bacterium]
MASGDKVSDCFILLVDKSHPGDFNMALDFSMANMVGSGILPPCVRLYGWSRTTLSIGRVQRLSRLNGDFIVENQIPVVRRPTGGRAVLHDDEITYAFALRRSIDWVKRGTIQTYKVIASILLSTLKRLGVVGADLERSRSRENLQACYGAPSLYEISVDRRKLVGSAQYRGEHHVLQHGSIPYTLDLETYSHCFKDPTVEKLVLEERVITLSEILHERPSLTNFAEALKKSIKEVLGVHVEVVASLPDELSKRAEVLRERFAISLESGRDIASG